MNIQPQPEILKIQDKKYRVYRLDEKKYKQQVQDVQSKAMISYSGGGWKNVEDEPSCNINREQKVKEIEQIKQKEKEIIKEYISEKQVEGNLKSLYTHFISVPLNKPLLISQIDMIKEDVKTDTINPNKAHITLLMLKLHDQKVKEKVQKAMQKIYPKLIAIVDEYDGKPKLDLKGLGYFGESPEKARVLYINIKNQCRGQLILADIVDLLCRTFIDNNILKESDLSHISYNKINKMYELDKMHITLMKATRENETFDVSKILEKYQNFELKNFIFDQIDISTLGEYQSNGYFKALESFNFNEDY